MVSSRFLLALLVLIAAHSVMADITTLRDSFPSSGRVARGEMLLYKYVSASESDVTFAVTSSGGDCDMYIGTNYEPSPSHHDFVSYTVEKDYSLTVPGREATFYVAIRGFSGTTQFQLTATAKQDDRTCNERGTYHAGSCTCFGGFSGPSCEVSDCKMEVGKKIAAQPKDTGMYYCSLDVAGVNKEYAIALTADVGPSYHTFLLRKGHLPSFLRFDERSSFVELHATPVTMTMTTTDSDEEVIYLGATVHDLRGFNIEVTETSSQECTSGELCSGRGVCTVRDGEDTCKCDAGYRGAFCGELAGEAEADTVYHGVAVYGSVNVYNYTVPSVNAVTVTLHDTSNSRFRCRLYGGDGFLPTSFHYSQMSGYSQNITMEVDDEDGDTWSFVVASYSTCEYTLVITNKDTCGSTTCVHGSCNPDGECMCADGWAGDACTNPVVSMAASQLVQDSVTGNAWKYYQLDVPKGSRSLLVQMVQQAPEVPVGSVWVFVREDLPPNLYDYDDKETDGGSSSHIIEHVFDSPPVADTTFVIGVFGGPVLDRQQSAPFALTAWVGPL